MDNCVIPQGYKATALGIIPQEWEVMPLSKAFHLQSGYAFKSELFSADQGVPIVRISNLPIDNKYVDLSDCVYYPASENIKQQFIVHKKDLLIAMSGATTGKTAIYNYSYNAFLNQRVGVFKQTSDKVCYQYLQAIVESQLFTTRLQPLLIAGAQPNISPSDIENMIFPFPPLAEQRKIAEVLGVWDEAIEKQARLIEKLALRKRGLMQRLLSAKLRLPGFSEPWKTHKLQELFTERNETNRTDLPLLSITGDRGVILQTESEKRDTSNDDKSKYKRIAKGDIGYNTMRMWQGRSALSGLEGIVSPAYTIVVPNTDVDGYYMSVLFKQPRLIYDFWTHSQGLVGDTLNCKYRDFGQVHICCPPLAEQKAITEVLTAADREIELAKEKLEYLRRQKRGLMQQLLTGKKRIKY